MKNIVLLGASGSIGKQTIDLINAYPTEFKLIGATANHSVDTIMDLIEIHALKTVGLNAKHKSFVTETYPQVDFFDTDALDQLIDSLEEGSIVVNALVGSVGLKPTIRAIEKNLDVLLANKETLVVGGELIKSLLKKSSSTLYPIDSEHSALAQCLKGRPVEAVEKVVITASGGSFRDLSRKELEHVSVKDALNHPNWTMGAKITIDSATMMNKVFEVIEAHYLFDLDYDKIEAVLHKESIVHGLVYYKDGNVLAHVGPSDMHIPILTALQGDKTVTYHSVFDLTKVETLHFAPLDVKRYPLFDLGVTVAKHKGMHVVTMNAANEEAVRLFLEGKITFLSIEKIIIECLNKFENTHHLTLDTILKHDDDVRKYIRKQYN